MLTKSVRRKQYVAAITELAKEPDTPDNLTLIRIFNIQISPKLQSWENKKPEINFSVLKELLLAL